MDGAGTQSVGATANSVGTTFTYHETQESATQVSPPEAGEAGGALANVYLEGPTSKAEKIKFVRLCALWEKANKPSARNKTRRERLQIILSRKLRDVIGKQSMFPMLRLLLPAIDTARGKFGIKDKTLAKLVVRALGWDPANPSAQAKRILDWNTQAGGAKKSGDLPGIVGEVIRGRAQTSKEWTVKQVNDHLDKLAEERDKGECTKLLTQAASSMSGVEFVYFLRIICQDLKLNVGHEAVLGALHRDAVAQYNSHLDLRRLCAEIRDPTVRLTPKVTFGAKCLPMLCAKPEMNRGMDRTHSDFGDSDFRIEDKLDGERLIVHWEARQRRSDKPSCKMFSRKGVDVGEKYGHLRALMGTLDHCITGARRVILDGEMLGYSESLGTFEDFGSVRTIAREMLEDLDADGDGTGAGRWLCVMVFDVLYVEGLDFEAAGLRDPGGPSLTGLPLRERQRVLEKIITPWEHHLEIVKGEIVDDPDKTQRTDKVMQALERVIASNGEGLVLKNLDSPYVLDGRNKMYWNKVKPDYSDRLNDTLDVIILGGYYAKGAARQGGVSTFLLGVAKDTEDGSQPREFLTFGKVGTGYSIEQLKELRKMLKKGERAWEGRNYSPPHLGDWRPAKTDDVPDFWYPPDQSVLLEVKCSELSMTENFSAFLTMRFPRCERIRYDKSVSDCLRLSELRDLFNQDTGTRRTVETRKLQPRKRRAVAVPIGSVPGTFSASVVRPGDVTHQSKLFQNLNAHVVGFKLAAPLTFQLADKEVTLANSHDVARLLVANGASNFSKVPPGKHIHLFVAPPAEIEHESFELKQAKQSGRHDLLSLQYVIRCLQERSVLRPEFADYVYISEATRRKDAESYDAFGDHLVQRGTKRLLLNAIAEASRARASAERKPDPKRAAERARKVLRKHESNPLHTSTSLFDGCVLYVDRFDEVPLKPPAEHAPEREAFRYSMLESAAITARLYDADLARAVLPGVTHIVIDADAPDKQDRLARLREAIKGHNRRTGFRSTPHLVNHHWIFEVVERKANWHYISPEQFVP